MSFTTKTGRAGAKASAGGRATAQGINEAAWSFPGVVADLIYDTLTPAERERIEKNVLRRAAELLMVNNEGRHNHQSWYNSGIGVIGFVLAEPEYVDHALNKGGSGFYYQMKNSVTADGMWHEVTALSPVRAPSSRPARGDSVSCGHRPLQRVWIQGALRLSNCVC
jgi:hypothetical protein